jgi:signal transduction histidine kinase/CheY-like chemotaxis protein
MKPTLRRPWSSFQVKILVPVIGVMAVLAVVPMWLANRHMAAQLSSGAAASAITAVGLFNSQQEIRANNLLRRYGDLTSEPRFRAVMQKQDPPTIAFSLKELLGELGADFALYSEAEFQVMTNSEALPGPAAHFAAAASASAGVALRGGKNSSLVAVDHRIFEFHSVPVPIGDTVLGALTLGRELGRDAVAEFARLTHSELVLLADGRIAASTVESTNLLAELALLRARAAGSSDSQPVTVKGEHYMGVLGTLAGSRPDHPLQYVLLSSFEAPLNSLRRSQRALLGIEAAVIVLGVWVVAFAIRRISRPLRDLRDTAEAVGRGDFSRRVRIQSYDECGELAVVFNQMTTNLLSSRAQLEETVVTLQATQTQLIQSEKLRALGTLAGGIAHDFNNILGAILGFGELALRDAPKGSRNERSLRQIMTAGQRAKLLVRQILSFSRRNEPRLEPVRVSSILEETVALLRATIPPSIEIRTRLETTADTTIGDPTQLHQVLVNLGTNAAQAMRDTGGILTFTLASHQITAGASGAPARLEPGGYLQLVVDDTGHGIDPAVLGRIFDPFFTTKPVGEGTGLGLSVVHGIIHKHGGDITVASTQGKGTTFTVWLPHRTTVGAPAAAGADHLVHGVGRILVVDDDGPIVDMMTQHLRDLGYDVRAEGDSVAALETIRTASAPFDLLITDLSMPRLSGLELSTAIRRIRPGMRVIVCTGSADPQDLASDPANGISAVVLKPIDFVELSRTIHRLLSTKSQSPQPIP